MQNIHEIKYAKNKGCVVICNTSSLLERRSIEYNIFIPIYKIAISFNKLRYRNNMGKNSSNWQQRSMVVLY